MIGRSVSRQQRDVLRVVGWGGGQTNTVSSKAQRIPPMLDGLRRSLARLRLVRTISCCGVRRGTRFLPGFPRHLPRPSACVRVDLVAAQSTAGASVAQGNTRAMGKPFSERLSTTTSRDAPRESQFGTLYAVLDGKGKGAINGAFEKLASPATAAHFHRGTDGQRGPQMSALTTVTKATTGVIKGDIVLTDADIAELQKGSFYVENSDRERCRRGSRLAHPRDAQVAK